MAVEIKMPQLSDTMNSGKILSWKKNIGDAIKRGDILAEVETDKANLEIEAFNPGVLLDIRVPASSEAKVGEVIAIIGQPGETAAANGKAQADPAPHAAAPAQPTKPTPEPVQAAQSPSAVATPVAPPAQNEDRLKASPLAKSIARQNNIDLTTVKGSGPNGRIVRKDVEAASSSSVAPSPAAAPADQNAKEAPAAEAKAPPASTGAISTGEGKLTPFSKMRETIARRMQESVNTSPHFYASTSICMDETLRLRELLKAQEAYKGISVNHFVIKAAAYALTKEPRVNRAVRDNQCYEPAQINIGVITAIEDGLLIPVVRETDKLHLKDLVFEVKAGVDRARAGRPSATDLSGGTFSISNLGMFDVEDFTAIINPGQGAVLAVGTVKQKTIVRAGKIEIASILRVTLSVDHRVIDGIMSAQFLKFFKEGLETPALLLL